MNSKQVNKATNRLLSFMGDVKDGNLRTIYVEVSFLGGLLHGYRREKLAA